MRSCLGLFLWAAQYTWAGPVSSENGLPYAAVNHLGNELAIGDIKTWVNWQSNSSEIKRYAVTRLSLKQDQQTPERFTGGIAAVDASDKVFRRVAAIACSESDTQTFTPERSQAFPGGEWSRTLISDPKPFETRRCAMLSSGTIAILYPESKSLWIYTQSQKKAFDLKDLAGKKMELVQAGSQFIVLSDSGYAFIIYPKNSAWLLSALLRHPYTYGAFSDTIRFAASTQSFIKVDANSVVFSTLTTSLAINYNNLFSTSQQVFANPCNENQACPPWISDKDETWIVSGYWGHYLGQGTQYERLGLPLAASNSKKLSGVAIAHSERAGRFLYLGNDDGDQGSLENNGPGMRLDQDTKATRWIVWVKQENRASATKTLLEVPLQVKQGNKRSLAIKIHNGPLPKTIPSSWIAWEPEASIKRPLFPSIIDPIFKEVSDSISAPWWPRYLNVSGAWTIAKEYGVTPSPVKVGLVDSGTSPDHPWLKPSLFKNLKDLPGNHLDDEDNGFVDDVSGYDFVQESFSPIDSFGHGTHVSGILSATDPSSSVILSPATNTQLLAIRALNRYGLSNSIDLARALIYAAQEEIEVINCSWGGGSDTQVLRDAFAFLVSRGITIFSSSGNDHLDTDKPGNMEVPKNYPGVIAVGAITENGKLASYSNYGARTVSFLSPGDKIWSTTMDSKFGLMSGTSMASPVAASVFIYLYGIAKSIARDDQRTLLKSLVLEVMCTSAIKTKDVDGKSVCGILSLEPALQLLFQRLEKN